MRFSTQVLPSAKGSLGIIELNNPRPLHALTLDMVECMTDIWSEWEETKAVKAVLVKSNPETTKIPAFCAGGDVKSVWKAGTTTSEGNGSGQVGLFTADFFRKEYILNHKMATCQTFPQVSLWNGLVMGGGAGISVHGKYRVSTEHTVFAMPETGIGLFCDVGSMWWMPRLLKGGLANYVALTGARLKPEDLIYTGLATHYIPSDRLEDLETELSTADDDVAPVLMSFHETPPVDPESSLLAQHRQVIDDCFQRNSVEAILAKLEEEVKGTNSDFATSAISSLGKVSPTSLKVTLEGLKRGAACESIGEALQMEYRMSQACMRSGSDFYEGIRALLVDKDHNPQWEPSALEDVTDAMVMEFFAPLPNEWQIPASPDSDSSSSSKL